LTTDRASDEHAKYSAADTDDEVAEGDPRTVSDKLDDLNCERRKRGESSENPNCEKRAKESVWWALFDNE